MNIIEDPYLKFYILSFLKKCNVCNKYQLTKDSDFCSVCKSFHCKECSKYLRKYYGFFENTFCNECSLILNY